MAGFGVFRRFQNVFFSGIFSYFWVRMAMKAFQCLLLKFFLQFWRCFLEKCGYFGSFMGIFWGIFGWFFEFQV